MGIYLTIKNRQNQERHLIYPKNIPINTKEAYKYLGDYLYDTCQKDHGLNAYWKSYLNGDNDALINVGVLLLKNDFEDEGRRCIFQGYKKSQSPKALYTFIKCVLLFQWEQAEIDLNKIIVQISEKPNEDAFDFLVWYYDYYKEPEHSITAFLQLKNERNQLKWLNHYFKYILTLGKERYGQSMVKHLKKKYPIVFAKKLLQAHLDLKSYTFIIEYTENNKRYALYQSIAYLHMNQIISSVKAANKICLEQLSFEERSLAYRHMAKLADLGGDFRRETQYLESLLLEWKQQERYIRREMTAHAIRFMNMES